VPRALLKTVAGSELIFDDASGDSPTITLTTKSGFKLDLDQAGVVGLACAAPAR